MPNLVSTFSPEFGFEINEIFDYIDSVQKDDKTIFWIALGSPLQDHIAAKVYEKTMLPTIAIGAALDFLTGNMKEAPKFMQYRGLEWIFRLYCEPRRLWKRYLLGNQIFVGLALFQLIKFRFQEEVKGDK